MNINFKEFPVLDTLDFEAVTVDATEWSTDNYSLMLTFWKTFPKSNKDERKPEGIILCTHMGGSSLREAYDNFELLYRSGLLNGISVYPNGVLWNTSGDIISEISWQDLEDYPDEEIESFEIIDFHKSPTLLQ